MGLLKWLKSREIDLSPSTRRRLSEPLPSLHNKVALSRNESYLKALNKFNNWRKLNARAKDKDQMPSELVESVINLEVSNENLDNSQLHYEEIDLNQKKTQHYFQAPKAISSFEFTNYENENQNQLKYSYRHSESASIDAVNYDYDEPLYALPFTNYSDESHGTTLFQNYVEQNFKFLHQADDELLSNAHEEFESKTNVVITDLDKSQDSNITPRNASNNSLIRAEAQFFSELLFYSLGEIRTYDHEGKFNISNGQMRRGEVDSIEISLLQANNKWSDAIYNNFEALRKLRHPNVVLLMGVSVDENSQLVALIFEPLYRLLFDLIYFEKIHVPVRSCLKYGFELIDAVTYLHKHKCVHSNICSRNIMLSRSTDTLKLGGFELNIFFDEQFYDNDSNPNSTNIKYLPLQLEYRKQHSQHFYQAPELLSDKSDGYITPTYQSDVYGICITLWEMLNRVIPYHQFTYSELIRVFSLKSAQLPVYEKERILPFKTFLEEGLAIQVESRTKSTIDLKNRLKRVNLSQNKYNYDIEPENLCSKSSSHHNCFQELNIKFGQGAQKRQHDLPSERTSTIKKRRNVSEWNRNKLRNGEQKKFEEPCSPITSSNIFDWNTDSSIKVPAEVFYPINKSCSQKQSTIPPNRRYNVSILIKSKCSPNGNSHIQDPVNISEGSINEHLNSNSVKHKIDIFESFLSASPTSNRFDNSIEFDVPPQKTYIEENYMNEFKNHDWKFASNMLNLKREKQSTAKPFHPVATEDFYIDDDFPNDCNLGANIELNYTRRSEVYLKT